MRPIKELPKDKLHPRLVFPIEWKTPMDCEGVIEESLRYAQPCRIERQEHVMVLRPMEHWEEKEKESWIDRNLMRMKTFTIPVEARY